MALLGSSDVPVIATWAAAAAFLLTGCGGIGIASESLGTPSAIFEDAGPLEEAGSGSTGDHEKLPSAKRDSGAGGVDSGQGPAEDNFVGSPLCGVLKSQIGGCDPEEPACLYTPEGGTAVCEHGMGCTLEPGTTVTPAACHVAPMSSVPTCTALLNTNGTQDAACMDSTQCAAGFECMGGTATVPGSCKHYCCTGTCDDPSPGTDPTPPFCDIEVARSGVSVPVCTTSKSCTPLIKGTKDGCPSGETCTVVTNTGQTACVTVGLGKAGNDCSSVKCGADLACIGNVCQRLCNSMVSCPTGYSCTQPSAFYGAPGDVGLCVKS